MFGFEIKNEYDIIDQFSSQLSFSDIYSDSRCVKHLRTSDEQYWTK